MIVLKDINKTYGIKKVLENITLHISPHEKVGVIGLNGAGKTTLLNVIAGMIYPDNGFIRVNGVENIISDRDRLKNMAYISGIKFQLWDDLPVKSSYENLAKMYGISHNELKKRLDRLTEVFHVTNYLNQLPKNLSLGEKMRCEIVYGLLINPELLMIDEALIGLDVSVKYKIMKYFENYKEENKSTLIYTSNNLSEVERLCDRIILIDKGRIIYDGDTKRLLKEFSPLYKVELVISGSIPDLEDLPVEKYIIESNILNIEYDKNKIDTSHIIKFIMEKSMVQDVRLYEPNLENVIKKVYYRQEPKKLNDTEGI